MVVDDHVRAAQVSPYLIHTLTHACTPRTARPSPEEHHLPAPVWAQSADGPILEVVCLHQWMESVVTWSHADATLPFALTSHPR